jgi:hypothetical protein
VVKVKIMLLPLFIMNLFNSRQILELDQTYLDKNFMEVDGKIIGYMLQYNKSKYDHG